MGHAALVRREINLAQARARQRCRYYTQMDSFPWPNHGKKQMLRVQPHQSRGVLQQKMRLASQS